MKTSVWFHGCPDIDDLRDSAHDKMCDLALGESEVIADPQTTDNWSTLEIARWSVDTRKNKPFGMELPKDKEEAEADE